MTTTSRLGRPLARYAFALSLAACTREPAPADAGDAASVADATDIVAPDAAGDAADDAAAHDASSGVGRECTGGAVDADGGLAQGDCPAGLACAPFPGGYCTATCGRGAACPSGATCADTIRVGELCLASCENDDQCRVGFPCDTAWSVCAPLGLLGPRAPRCTLAVPPRRTFGPARQITTARAPGQYHFEPAAALGSDGRVVAAFIARNGLFDANPLGVVAVRADGTAEPERSFAGDRREHFDPWMTVDRRGRFHLAWLGHDGGGADLRSLIGHATSDDGATWSAPRVAHDLMDCGPRSDGCLDKPMIAAGPAPGDPTRDALYVTYSARAGVRMRRSLDGGATWERSVAVPVGFYGDLEVASDGAVHVATAVPSTGPLGTERWFGATSNLVRYARSDDGATWPRVSTVSAPGEAVPIYFSNAQVAPDTARRLVYVVYTSGDADGVWNVVLATSRDDGATWSRVRVNDDAPCAAHMVPNLAVDPTNGAVHVTWIENRAGQGRAAYARCDAGGARCGPNESVSETPFAAFAIVRHSTRWLGEYNSLLLDATRRRLHYVWSQPVMEGGVAVARVFHASAPL